MKRIFGAAPAVKTKLVVRKHDFSSAQTAYQRARSAPSSQLIFYKDATPRGEHYIRCSVACEPARPDVVPLRLALCYEDGTDVSPQDASCLKILGEATHLSCPPHAKETTFYYRLELGSFRRADRKFLVRVSAADGAEAGLGGFSCQHESGCVHRSSTRRSMMAFAGAKAKTPHDEKVEVDIEESGESSRPVAATHRLARPASVP